MADSHWASYVGMATGIAGAVMGFLAYRRSTQIKALDLRLELRKADDDLIATFENLDKLLSYANKSRERVAAATGGLDSGAMVLWKQELVADTKKLDELKAKHEDLESKLVDVHRMQGAADALLGKYKSALASDDERRKELREGMLNMQRRSS